MQFQNMNHKLTLVIALVVTLFSSCIKDNYDEPPVNGADPNLTVTHSIRQLKHYFKGTASVQITEDIIIAGVVAADDRSGNFYKTLILQDSSAGIAIRLDESGLFNNYMVGRRVFIKCKGLYLGAYNGLVQLGAAATAGTATEVDPVPSALIDKFLVKGSLNNQVDYITITDLSQLVDSIHQNRLIRLDNVQFSNAYAGYPYADGILQLSKNTIIELYDGTCTKLGDIILRNSGFATFANELTPTGKGTLYAVYSVFGTDKQLFIRDVTDLQFNGSRCASFLKDFEDNTITSGGWTQQNVLGNINWTTNSQGAVFGDYYAQCRNFVSPNNIPCESWLISPSVDLTTYTNPNLSFQNAYKYTGAPLQVLVSTDYTSGLPSTATWTQLTYTPSPGNFSWAHSGNIPLAPYIGTNVHVAFKYLGSSSDGSTWEIDDILIKEN